VRSRDLPRRRSPPINRLSEERSNIQQDAQWSDTPDSKFYDDVLLPPWYMVLAAGSDFAGMRSAFDTAERTYFNRTQLWFDYRIKGFERTLDSTAGGDGVGFPLTNGSGLRGPSMDVWTKWDEKRSALVPRVADLRARFDRGEQIDFEEVYALQRDAYIVVALYACTRSVLSLFNVWEKLEKIEGQVVDNFDALQEEIRLDALLIHGIVMSDGDLVQALKLLDAPAFQSLPDRIEWAVRDAQDDTRLAMLGIMVVATIASAGAAAIVEAGALAVLGTELGATALGALNLAEFIVEVGTFTLTYDALSALAFGQKFDWSKVPPHLAENAILFGVLKWVGGRTLKLFGNENVGLLRALAQFAARHAINLGAFAGTALAMQVYKTGHLPESWREFAEDTIAAYVVLGTVGYAFGQIRVGIRQRMLIEPRLQKAGERMDQMVALQGEIDRMLVELGITTTGAAPGASGGDAAKEPAGKGSRGKEPASPERLRDRVADLARLANQIVDDLQVTGSIDKDDAAALRQTIDFTSQRLGTAKPGFGSGGLPDIAKLDGITALGDGHTYQYSTEAAGEMRKALVAYTDKGYVMDVDPISGDLTLRDPKGTEVARFTPELGDRVVSSWLLRLRISGEARSGLGRLGADSFSAIKLLPPAVLEALGGLADRSPEAAKQVLDSHLLDVFRGKPDKAVQMLQLVADLQDLQFADTHVHVMGALPPGEILIERLTSANNARELDQKLAAVERIVGGVLDRLPDNEETADKRQRWEALRPDLEVLAEMVRDDLRDGQTSQDTVDQADRLSREMERILTLTAGGGDGIARDAFFYLYDQVRQSVWKPGQRGAVLGRAAGEVADRGVAYVELRTGMPADLLAQLRAQGIVGPDGALAVGARVVVTIKRGEPLAPDDAQRIFDDIRRDPTLSRVVVGFDLVGEEATGDLAQYRALGDLVLAHNFRELSRVLGNRADVLSLAQQRLGGVPPLDYGEAFVRDLETTPADPADEGFARSQLAWVNRALAEAMRDVDARSDMSFEQPKLFGLTAHAGEEVGQSPTGWAPAAGNATLEVLLNSVQQSIDSGVDRIGHGVVLGIPLPDGLPALGFRFEPSERGIVWIRDVPGGQQEVYTSDRIYELEAQRRALIDRIAELGLTIEVNPSSNIRLSGLDPATYPMSQLLAARPDLRLSVSTDNPAFHATDPAMELAILATVADAPFSRTVMTFLEGYASRLGQRSLGDAEGLRNETLSELVRRTPVDERLPLLQLLETRYMLGEPVPVATPTTETFRAALSPTSR
jgi:hypothetical protein